MKPAAATNQISWLSANPKTWIRRQGCLSEHLFYIESLFLSKHVVDAENRGQVSRIKIDLRAPIVVVIVHGETFAS
jgi:hypothetical protein